MALKWTENLRKTDPYVPGEQSSDPDIIKLNANENPYPPSPMAAKALRDFSADALRFYPNSDSLPLKQALADYYNVGVSNVFVGNGSDDVLAAAFQALFCGDLPIAFPDLTYSFYPVWCSLYGVKYKTHPVDDDFRINPDDYREPNGGVIIPNPNAPTSIGEGTDFVEKIMQYNGDSVVVIDEAYVDFGCTSCIGLTKKYENLLVTGSFSKSRSMAGLRIGFAVGSERLISTLETVKNSYNSYTVDSLSIAAGRASVLDDEYFKATCKKIIATRERLTKALSDMGFYVLDSRANFVFATSSSLDVKDLFEYLKARKIYIRHFSLPRIDNYVRISIGTDDEIDALLKVIKEYIKANK